MERNVGKSSAQQQDGIAFLHRLDGVNGEVQFVRTNRDWLREASFLDGRQQFWDEETIAPLAIDPSIDHRDLPAVFHVGFCGSTLLARMLDDPGHILALKEPQCLADIAGQRALIDAGHAAASLDSLIDYALDQLDAAGGPDTEVLLKPTNWVNSLLPELCTPGRIGRAIFVSMNARAYLAAVIRGGRERIGFCTRLAAAIAAVVPGGNATLTAAIEAGGDPLECAARIVALLHAMQEGIFDHVIRRNGWSAGARIDFANLVQHPASTLRHARKQLGLALHDDEFGKVAALMERHAKDPSSVFHPNHRLHEDIEIEVHHGARFDAALDWVQSQDGNYGWPVTPDFGHAANQ